MEPIYEGKAKRLYTTDNPNVLRMEYKDDATAGNGAKKAQFENKGRMNKAITLVIYRMLESKGVKIDHVVSIEVDDGAIEGRMTGRRVCAKCGASYHIVANPPKTEGVCDHCGGELIIRKDDKPETVRHRLEVYHAATEVLKDFYGKLGRLRVVNGNQSIEGANEDVLKAIGAKV